MGLLVIFDVIIEVGLLLKGKKRTQITLALTPKHPAGGCRVEGRGDSIWKTSKTGETR